MMEVLVAAAHITNPSRVLYEREGDSRVGLSNRKDRPDLKGLDEFPAFGVYCRQ